MDELFHLTKIVCERACAQHRVHFVKTMHRFGLVRRIIENWPIECSMYENSVVTKAGEQQRVLQRNSLSSENYFLI